MAGLVTHKSGIPDLWKLTHAEVGQARLPMPSTSNRFYIIQDADGRHKAGHDAVNLSNAARVYPSPTFLNALLIQEPLFSDGMPPPVFTRAYAWPYHSLSGKLCPSTAAAVCASSTMPSAI
jgi:hypothetical protein